MLSDVVQIYPLHRLLQTRTTEKPDMIVGGEGYSEPDVSVERLLHARIDGPGPVLAYMAEGKTHVNQLMYLYPDHKPTTITERAS